VRDLSSQTFDPAGGWLMSTSAEDFVNRVVLEVPVLGPLLEEHTNFNQEILPHMFFGDVTRWFQEELERDPNSPDALKLLRYIESSYDQLPDDAQNVIDVSFVENLDVKSAGVRMLGPTLHEVAKDMGLT
jgi:hypothetical protein